MAGTPNTTMPSTGLRASSGARFAYRIATPR
jgi:hypothetical protein